MTKLIVTTVVHGSSYGESHGGAYIVDLEKEAVFQVIDLTDQDIEWYGDDGERGFRGIAIDDNTVYLAAGNSLKAYSREFKPIRTWRNSNLVNCRGLFIYQRKLYVVSSGNDCILAFDLDKKEFDWAMHVKSDRFRFKPMTFDPIGDDGPLVYSKLQLTNVFCDEGGIRVQGLTSGGVLHFNGKKINMSLELPEGSQDARFFRSGAVFNDSHDGVLRYVGAQDDAEDRALAVPFFTGTDHYLSDPDETRKLKRGYGRGLCLLSDTIVAGGCTPAGVSVYDLRENKRLMTVTFTKNGNVAVNCIERW